MATQHATLSPQRWASFSRAQQILMIANELNRAGKLTAADDGERRANAYGRSLQLFDLTIEGAPPRALRRELLRLRDVVAELYLSPQPRPEDHRAAMVCLLRFTVESSRQLAP